MSVLLCTYNGAAFVRQQVDSILAQTLRDFELIIVDDRSADDTFPILERYAASDNRIRLFQNETRLDINANFEKAISFARGEFLAFSDQDDIWLPQKLATQLALFNTEDVLLTTTSSARFAEEPDFSQRQIVDRRLIQGGNLLNLLVQNSISGHNIMVRASFVGQALPFPKTPYYDYWLAFAALTFGSIHSSAEVLAFHRQHTASATLAAIAPGNSYNLKPARMAILDNFIQYLERVRPQHKALAPYKQFRNILSAQEQGKFSWRMFAFLMQHRSHIFFYKLLKHRVQGAITDALFFSRLR